MRPILKILATLICLIQLQCTSKSENEVWIYTSLYKDTISDIKPKLEKTFPEYKFMFYQAGSEDIAAKVNAEILAGGTKADILISSDRFWYEEMAKNGKLQSINSDRLMQIPADFKHPESLYHTLSLPVMVLAYNSEVMKASEVPKSYKELTDSKWKNKFSTGSPLSSGTNFTTVAFLSKAYGWDFFKKLQSNGTISEGGNSAVLRRIQNKERPIGWVLLENLLRFQDKDKRLKVIFPTDGVVVHNNVLALPAKKQRREIADKVAHWLFGQEGQKAMLRSFMYSPFSDMPPPVGAPQLASLNRDGFPWNPEFIQRVVKSREKIKEQFSEIMFN